MPLILTNTKTVTFKNIPSESKNETAAAFVVKIKGKDSSAKSYMTIKVSFRGGAVEVLKYESGF